MSSYKHYVALVHALAHLTGARHASDKGDIILEGNSPLGKDITEIVKQREIICTPVHDINREYNQKFNRKTGAAAIRRASKKRRRTK